MVGLETTLFNMQAWLRGAALADPYRFYWGPLCCPDAPCIANPTLFLGPLVNGSFLGLLLGWKVPPSQSMHCVTHWQFSVQLGAQYQKHIYYVMRK